MVTIQVSRCSMVSIPLGCAVRSIPGAVHVPALTAGSSAPPHPKGMDTERMDLNSYT